MTIYEIGQRIKELRKAKAMTGQALAELSGISQSKISKIESGKTTLDPDAITKLLNILDAPQTIQQQVDDALRRPGSRTQAFRFDLSANDLLDIEQDAKKIWVYTFAYAPAILQTVSARKAMLELLGCNPAETSRRIAMSLRRQDLLWDASKDYRVITAESGLYERITDLEDHIAQLDRIERMLGLTHPKIGIVPYQKGTGGMTASNFAIYDQRLVYRELGSATVESRNPDIVQDNIHFFQDIQHRAVYGDEAIAIVRTAIEYFSGQTQ